MVKEETISTKYNRLMKSKYGTSSPPPPGVKRACMTCRRAEFHQWQNGNVKDPMICKCRVSGEYNVAKSPQNKCTLYEYSESWDVMIKHPKIHNK